MTAPSPLATPMPWNLVAAAYEAEVVPQFEHFAKEALRLAHPPAGSRVADVASGPGTLSLVAAEAGLSVDAIDFSGEMIDRLERRARSRGIRGVTARVGDGQALPFETGAYSGAFSLFGLMFFPDRAKGFAELRRILAPGARAVVSSWQPLERVPAMAAMFGALQEALKTFGEGGPPRTSDAPLTTPEACRSEMGRSFVDVEVHPVSTGVEFPSVNALWESMQRTMAPIVLMRRGVGEERWPALSTGARAAMAAVLGEEGPVTLAMNAWLTVGVAG